MNRPIPKEIKELSIERIKRSNQIIKAPQPQGFEVGQIWSTFQTLNAPDGRKFQTDEPRLVVVIDVPEPLSEYALLKTAIISLDTHMASQFDLIIKEDESILGFEFMVEVWNETPVYRGHLKRFLTKLPDKLIEILVVLYAVHVTDAEISSEIENRVGLRIFDDSDLRITFQEQEVDAASYLAKASTAMLAFEQVKEESLEITRDFWKALIGKKFEIKPIYEKLNNYLSLQSEFAFAHASDKEARNTWIVHNPDAETCFTLELLCNRRQSPNPVYFYIHDLSEKLINCKSIISIITPEIKLRSEPTVLLKDKTVVVGEIRNFKYDDVMLVKIEIEEECLENG